VGGGYLSARVARTRRFWAVAPALALAAFLAARLTAWPPHEDEMLVLTVGRGSFSDLIDTVVHQRGGAPLHFALAWVVEHAGGGLVGIRLLSAIFAVASVPLIAALTRRLADERAALVATVLAVSSWVLIYHAIYARMYSLFLFTSALSYLALLHAHRDGGLRRWSLWVLATLLVVATHPYGALVLGSQVVHVLLTRRRLGESLLAFAAVAILGLPFWIIDRVLAGRFDVGVGSGGGQLGRPDRVLEYLAETAGDFSAGEVVLPAVLFLAAVGAWAAWRERRSEALLALAAVATPTAAFMLTRVGGSAAPETRHLIFVLPFFLAFVASGVVRRPTRIAAALTVVLAAGSIAWAWDKTPSLFRGEPEERVAARESAAEWLAATGRPDDILLGFEPVFVAGQNRDPAFSRLIVPRADPRLALRELQEARTPLGRGVWVFSAWGPTSADPRLSVPWRLPRPGGAFEARIYGPYLVLRSRSRTVTPERYLQLAAAAMIVGKTLGIADADVNFTTIVRATMLLRRGYEASSSKRSASTISR
jgi:4-amino-4-deoxy-L-arabinose transferase-like glycosyltransferase